MVRLVLLALLVASGVAAGPISDTVVLAGGEALTGVTAEVRDGLVWVDHGNGRLQAFALEDVDLVASGLVETAAAPTEAVPPTPTLASDRVLSADHPGPSSEVMITDADVEHVAPPDVAAEEAGSEDRRLEVTNLREKAIADKLSVTGLVTNRADLPAAKVTITVAASIGDAPPLGTGSVTLRQPLKAGSTIAFSLMIDEAAEATTLKGTATGQFPEVAADAAADGRPAPPAVVEDPHARPTGHGRDE